MSRPESCLSMSQSSAKILLIGENATDVFVTCGCARLSPEAPVPVARPLNSRSNPGMAANVKANIESLGGPPVQFIHQAAEIIKTRYVDDASGQQLLRVDHGDDSFEPDFWSKIVAAAAEGDQQYSAIVISDYGKGLLRPDLMGALAEMARALGIPSFLDTKAILSEWSRAFTFVKINDKEYRSQIAAGIARPWEYCQNLIVTRGRDGADLYDQSGEIVYHSDSCAGKVWSVSGGGDTVLAALVVKYLVNDGNIKTALDYAMRAAAVAVSKPGVVAVDWREVEDYHAN